MSLLRIVGCRDPCLVRKMRLPESARVRVRVGRGVGIPSMWWKLSIFTDKRLKKAARDNKQLVGECIGNAIDIHTFQVMMKDAGFRTVWPVTVSHFGAAGMPAEIIDPETNFFKPTFSAYKLADRTSRWEGHVATYTGGIVDCEDKFDFDANHVFPAGI
jgi:hypothetical protein